VLNADRDDRLRSINRGAIGEARLRTNRGGFRNGPAKADRQPLDDPTGDLGNLRP
jgi:hypothetical protein